MLRLQYIGVLQYIAIIVILCPCLQEGLPPTYVCHGTHDVEIDIEQSDVLVGALVRNRIVHGYEAMEGMGHRFDEQGEVEMESMYRFMQQHL